MSSLKSAAQTFFCLGLVLAARPAHAACTVPTYYPVRDFVNAQTGAGAMHVWIPPSAFTVAHVACLAQTLKSQSHRWWTDVIVLFFSSEEAAEQFDASGMSDLRDVIDSSGKVIATENIGRLRRELRALYVLSAKSTKTISRSCRLD
jgi:hypothetical protein